MNSGVFLWLVIFGLAALCFFTVAAIVAVKGSYDLRALLRTTPTQKDLPKPEK